MTPKFSKWLNRYTIIYVLGLLVLSYLFMFINYDPTSPVMPQYLACVSVMFMAVPVCYYVASKLIPRYLYRRKIFRFILYIIFLSIANAVITYVVALTIYHILSGHAIFRNVLYFASLTLVIMVVDIVLIGITSVIKIISDRYFMEQAMIQIEREKISTELNFLRSQVNPHFLFNVLNTIYFQIDKKNTEARLSVEKLSEMLRYQLYECTTDKISIHKELNYIENYVAIQTLRMEKGSDVSLVVDHQMESFFIAPLLILPIVENAFKHVSNFKEPSKNKVHIVVKKGDDHNFFVESTNSYDDTLNGEKHVMQSGGLGMQNLKRRLELLYPDRYELTINKEANIYHTILKLQYD